MVDVCYAHGRHGRRSSLASGTVARLIILIWHMKASLVGYCASSCEEK